MPPLDRILSDYDLNLLRVIAELWGFELTAPNQREAVTELARAMLDAERVAAMVEALPEAARSALEAVRLAGGRVPLARFARTYGEVRAMGPARREREQPWRNAPSTAEVLWYRALTGHAFFQAESGPQEFVVIPDDLFKLLSAPSTPSSAPAPGRPERAPERYLHADAFLADDMTTLLAYAQIVPLKLEGGTFTTKLPFTVRFFLRAPDALDLCFQLSLQLNLLSGTPLKPDPESARPFLQQTRLEQTRTLAEAWRTSQDWNDLLRLPGLIFEGQTWRNDPVTAREAILRLLREVPPGTWWSLDSFVAAVKERAPDFQRPAGDYDSWYIRDAQTQAYLRGFEHWEQIEGTLIRWMIQGPLCWLGLVEVSGSHTAPPSLTAPSAPPDDEPRHPTAFRVTPSGSAFLGQAEWPAESEAARPRARVTSDGLIRVPAATNPHDRFRIARVTKWIALEGGLYTYRLTPSSLRRAERQGVTLGRITTFLHQIADEHGVPSTLLKALERWARNGAEVLIQETVVLKLRNPELLDLLRRLPHVNQYLGRTLGPATVEVRPDDIERLRAALAALGLLAD